LGIQFPWCRGGGDKEKNSAKTWEGSTRRSRQQVGKAKGLQRRSVTSFEPPKGGEKKTLCPSERKASNLLLEHSEKKEPIEKGVGLLVILRSEVKQRGENDGRHS